MKGNPSNSSSQQSIELTQQNNHSTMPSSSSSSSSTNPSKSDESQSSTVSVISWILGSVFSSVGLILINKVVMGPDFRFSYAFTLTSAHFLITTIGMELMALMGFFKRSRMPMWDTFIMAVFCIGSVGFMNLSLKLNSVGFYQLLKLLCIPCMVWIQTIFYGILFTRKVKLILLVVLLGVGIATVNDMEVTFYGSIMGALAVLFTTQFQIWQGEKQKKYNLNAMQMNHAQAFPSFLFCSIVAFCLEFHGEDPRDNVLLHQFQEHEVTWIIVSCVLALSVNLCTYGLIGKTSPVTYQVVGHAKTILILIGGFLLYDISPQQREKLPELVAGIITAMVGVIVYGHLRHYEGMKPKPDDVLDYILPQFILNLLNTPQTNNSPPGPSSQYQPLINNTNNQVAPAGQDDDNDSKP